MVDEDRKRELKKAAREAERGAFLERMPFRPNLAFTLFDKLDGALSADACDHAFRHSIAASGELGLSADVVLAWLKDEGAGCDCEVLANIEPRVEEASGGRE
jgi:hypothetical protein